MKQTKWMWVAATLVVGIVACATDDGGNGGDDEPDPDPGPVEPCGNGICRGNETQASCPADCDPGPGSGNNPVCGNSVCEAGETTSCAADCTASLRTVNSSSYAIFYLYVRRCTESAWSVDQLGANVIPSGSAFTLTGFPPGCWMFKANDNNFVHTWQSPAGVQMVAGQQYTWTLLN